MNVIIDTNSCWFRACHKNWQMLLKRPGVLFFYSFFRFLHFYPDAIVILNTRTATVAHCSPEFLLLLLFTY